jgi:hypothetical protein
MHKKRFISALSAAILAGIISSPSSAAIITAEWSNPVVAGNEADGATGALTFLNNSSTAVFSISSMASLNDTITWGVFNGTTNPCTIAPTPCFSTITFTGTSPVPANPATPFQIGTISYTNGTSDLNSIIFGATLTFFKVDGASKTR